MFVYKKDKLEEPPISVKYDVNLLSKLKKQKQTYINRFLFFSHNPLSVRSSGVVTVVSVVHITDASLSSSALLRKHNYLSVNVENRAPHISKPPVWPSHCMEGWFSSVCVCVCFGYVAWCIPQMQGGVQCRGLTSPEVQEGGWKVIDGRRGQRWTGGCPTVSDRVSVREAWKWQNNSRLKKQLPSCNKIKDFIKTILTEEKPLKTRNLVQKFLLFLLWFCCFRVCGYRLQTYTLRSIS